MNTPPVIVYTGKELTREEEMELRRHAETIIIKGVKSEERLIDEVSLFLHKTVNSMPPAKREMILNLHERDAILSGRTILLVDDDMRNLFALSKILGEKGLNVLKAEDGQKALAYSREPSGNRPGASGHHDAGDGRLRNRQGNPQTAPFSMICRSSP